jgi:predicted ATPase/DNA-binding SARP family transcriptional activator
MRFEVLGPLRVTAGEHLLSLGPPQQQRLLALLLVSHEGLSAESIVEELWSGQPPPSARHLIEVHASTLRAALAPGDAEPRVVFGHGRYRLRVGSEELDAWEFERRAAAGRSLLPANPAAARDELLAAQRLWRGSPFGGLAEGCAVLEAEAARWEALHLDVVEARLEADLALGRHVEVLPELERLTEEHPFVEPLWHHRMLALYRAGRPAEAIQVGHQLRGLLADELGVDPSPAIGALEGRILAQDPGLQWHAPPPTATVPVPSTSFVGRVAELAEVTTLIGEQRLVTLVGPGGVGKTRLAIAAADRLRGAFPDGTWWIDLVAVAEPADVDPAVARALGVTTSPDPDLLGVVCRALARKRALLVIDNCERVAPAVAQSLARILLAAPGVRVLATSRSPLHLEAEQLWPVPGLACRSDAGMPDPPEAVRLFQERARAADPAAAAHPDAPADIAELCRRLDGLPLTIEMAASRSMTLSPREMLVLLDARLALLHTSASDVADRHHSLEAALGWSYEQLSAAHQLTFDRAGVLVGPFDLAAAAEVACGVQDTLAAAEALTALLDVSLLSPERLGQDRGFRMLETVRTYARDHLSAHGQLEDVEQAHSEHFLALVASAGAAYGTPAFADWVRRIQHRYPDVRAALAHSLAHEPRERTLRAALGLFGFWYRTGDPQEADTWSGLMLDRADGAPEAWRAAAHLCRSFACDLLTRAEEGARHADEAIRLFGSAGDDRGMALSLWGRASLAMQLGDGPTAVRCCHESLAMCERSGDRWGRAAPLATLALLSVFGEGDLTATRVMAEEALLLHRELGDLPGQTVLNPLPMLALRQADLESAQRYAAEMVQIAAGTGWEAASLSPWVEVLIASGTLEQAQSAAERQLLSALDAGLENHFRMALRNLSLLASRRGEARLAAVLLGGARHNMPHYGAVAEVFAEVRSTCLQTLGADAADAAEAWGGSMTHAELVDVALERHPHPLATS